MKKIVTSQSAKEIAKETITEIAGIVKKTLGPGGNPIVLQQSGQNPDGTPKLPVITKDGVSVAETISYKDPAKDTIAKAIINVAKNTVNSAGDGPQPLWSKILTPKGFVEMRDIEVGMELCGTDNTIQTVLGVYPKGQKEVYQVTFSDGRVVDCCEDHLWTVTVAANQCPTKTKTTKELAKDFCKTTSQGHNFYKYYVPQTSVEFFDNNDEMPLDPYLVGLLLGDGSLSGTGSIELSLGYGKERLINKITLPEGLSLTTQKVEHKNYFRVKIKGKTEKGETIHQIIQSLGLLGVTSSSKFIPKSYLYSSLSNREKLLQGLLDTDGYINNRGLFEFSTISDELSNDFKTLAWSLGIPLNYRLHTREKDKNSYSNTPIHRMSQLVGYKYGHKIVNIEPTGMTTEMQCIKVSNDNHLYITDNFIPTHNTSTSLVLAEAIYKQGYEYISQGRNTVRLYDELKDLSNEIIQKLDDLATPIKNDPKMVYNIAKISANGDESVAKVVQEAIEAVGEDGHISLEDGHSRETELRIVEGAMYKQGYKKFSPQGLLMVTDKGLDQCILEQDGVGILLYNGRIDDVMELANFMMRFFEVEEGQQIDFSKINHPLLIIANDFSDPVKDFILQNRVQMKLPIAAIKTPYDGSPNARSGILEDLAALTGGTVAARGIVPIKDLKVDQLGMASKVTIGAEETVFYGGSGEEETVLERVDELKKLISESTIEYDKTNYRIRLGKLTNGIAIIKVGGSSELEIVEKKDRIEDALCAAKVAISDGIISGGGSVLYHLGNTYAPITDAERILAKAIQEPFKQILINAGLEPLAILMKLDNSSDNGYDARELRFVDDMITEGIIDPVKATKSALENAVSIAGLLLTTGGMVIEDDSKSEAVNPLAAMMGG